MPPKSAPMNSMVSSKASGAGTRWRCSQNMSGMLSTARNSASAKGSSMLAPSRNPATTTTKEAPNRRKRAPGVSVRSRII